jgi:hypothetical protein
MKSENKMQCGKNIESNANKEKFARVILVHQTSALAKLIQLSIKCYFNHLAVLMPDDTVIDLDRPGVRSFTLNEYLRFNQIKLTSLSTPVSIALDNYQSIKHCSYADSTTLRMLAGKLYKPVLHHSTVKNNCIGFVSHIMGFKIPLENYVTPAWFEKFSIKDVAP